MHEDKLKLFVNEDELRNFCIVNGYDIGLTDATVARWKSNKDKKIPLIKAGMKKITRMMDPNAVESKD
jgi:hypothetical protein|tara:strand:+ start:697 stop:900 length:204 start_codon:yes stop_codon:yes gene_type:complete